MTLETMKSEYFDWLCDIVCKDRFSEKISYRKLLSHLHSREFTYILPMDANRAVDGENLRYRFSLSFDYDTYFDEDYDEPCSVLEMIIALAIRCEECIMDDPKYGNRTGQWFWGMISNLGLGGMTDYNYKEIVVDRKIDIFLDRKYDPDGRGGLFTIRNCEFDLRDVEIWRQLCYYLDTMV